MSWSAYQTAALRTYWGRGKTARQIGVIIGKSKNAVIGKADRLGLKRLQISAAMRALAICNSTHAWDARIQAAHDRMIGAA